MKQPERIQRKRVKGWRTPENTVYVGRPTMFGNPFAVGKLSKDGNYLFAVNREQATAYFRKYSSLLTVNKHLLEPLKGKNLACWCPLDQPCHADVLLEAANSR